jgi:hypothetical protein
MAVGWYLAPKGTQADTAVLYFQSTGHRLDNSYGFLGFWRAANGPTLLGAPVTEVLVEDGRAVQYFERGRLGLHPEYDNAVLPGRVAAEYSEALWQNATTAKSTPDVRPGVEHFAATGYNVAEPFLSFWKNNGGLEAFGYPLGEPVWEYVGAEMLRVQYFERVRLEHHPLQGPGAVLISPLGQALALLRGHSTAAVSADGALTVDNVGNVVLPPTATAAPPPPLPAPLRLWLRQQRPSR